jgi:transposase
MQDNAPPHSAHMTQDFLKTKKVQTLPWPPQSPDFNPIENLWAILKRRLYSEPGYPTSKAELIDKVFEKWSQSQSTHAHWLRNFTQ